MTNEACGRRRRAAGFTLLEMLIVLTIIALIATISAPLLKGPSDSQRLDRFARNVAADLRRTRALAIGQNQALDFLVDIDRRTYRSDAVGARALPGDISIQLTIGERQRNDATNGGFRFFPNGASSGGDIVLRAKDKIVRISINWLTGEARVEL